VYAFNTRILTIAVGNSDHAGNVNILLYYDCGLPTTPPTKLELATTNERQSCKTEVHSLIFKTGLDYLWSVSLHCCTFPLTPHVIIDVGMICVYPAMVMGGFVCEHAFNEMKLNITLRIMRIEEGRSVGVTMNDWLVGSLFYDSCQN
jgi:hypothetical protein